MRYSADPRPLRCVGPLTMRNPKRSEPPSTVAILLTMAAASGVMAQSPWAEEGSPENMTTAFERAREQMVKDKAPGLVFVLPAIDAPFDRKVAERLAQELVASSMRTPHRVELRTARDVLLARVQRLRASRTPAAIALRLLTVPIVAEPATCGARPGETIVLLSADGRRVAGFEVELGDEAAVLDALTPDVLARKAVEPRRANVEPALVAIATKHRRLLELAIAQKGAGEGLTGEQGQELHATRRQLAARLTAAAPALVEFRGERAEFLTDDGMHSFLLLDGSLPFGTAVAEQWDPCPPCGMMAVPMAQRSTLKLLAK